MIEVVAATRLDAEAFGQSPLGFSLKRVSHYRSVVPHISFSNTDGLPDVYNRRINADSRDDILIFTHDDVWINDFYFVYRVVEGLQHFQVIGVAGDTRLVDTHVAWLFKNSKFEFDTEYLTGSVAHGNHPFASVYYYGHCPKPCELLDGVFLAARRSVLRQHNILFDPQFAFHFYDLDFCRTARARGLTLGTWPIALTHASVGAYGSPNWTQALQAYKAKWLE